MLQPIERTRTWKETIAEPGRSAGCSSRMTADIESMAELVRAGIGTFFVAGNRDFLLGERYAASCGMRGPATRRYGPAKRLLISPVLDRLGLSGFYFPFTGEAKRTPESLGIGGYSPAELGKL